MFKTTNIQKIFNKIFIVQFILNITSYFCNIINGLIAGNFLDNLAVSCNSLIIPFNMAIVSIAYIFSSSSQIICGKYLGIGDKKSLNKVFSHVLSLSFVIAIIFTLLTVIFPEPIVKFLGANSEILSAAKTYLLAYSIGIFAYIMSPILISFLNIENDGSYATKSILVLAALYIVFGYLFVNVLKLSYFGLGLTNSLSQICTLLFLFIRIIKNKNQIRFVKGKIDLSLIKKILFLGLPSGYSGILLSIRNIVFNNFLIRGGGVIALAAYSILQSSLSIEDALITSSLNTVQITSSICIGEKNKDELKQLISHIFKFVLPVNLLIIVIQMLLASKIVTLFTSDINVIPIARLALILYLSSTIFEMCNDSLISVYTVFERYKFINFFNVMHSIAFHLIFLFITFNILGPYAVFGSYIFAEIASLLIYIVYAIFNYKRLPKSYMDLLTINNRLDNFNKLYLSFNTYDNVINVSKKVIEFCNNNGIDKKESNLAGLCVEEMAINIFDHGFTKKKVKNKRIDIFVIIDNGITIRIRDNAIAFDPESRSIIFDPKDPCKNIGLRIVKNISKEFTYQNLFGLNNTIIKV